MANGINIPPAPPNQGAAPPGAPGPMAGGPPPQDIGNDEALNPILESLQTLQTFIAAQREQGNPGAADMAKNLLTLIQSIGGNVQKPAAGGAPSLPPTAPPAALPRQPRQGRGEGPTMRPEMAGGGARPASPIL